VRAYLGIGSNLGDRWAHLRAAVVALAGLDPGVVVSPVYETAPLGGPAGQGSYLNCVARLETTISPTELLRFTQGVEEEQGRVRAERWGPRTLDIDVLVIDGFQCDEPQLVVPHPRMHERAFVLAPLEDLDPSAVPDGWRSTVGDQGDVRLVGALLPPFVAHPAGERRRDPQQSVATSEFGS